MPNNPRNRKLPDFSNKSVVDNYMGKLDTKGVSRRDFLALASAGAAASSAAAALGIPMVAVAAPSGKIVYLEWSARVGYLVNAARGCSEACKAFGLKYQGVDAEFDMNRQLDQFQEAAAAGVKTILLHSSDGSALKREAAIAAKNHVWFANVWATLPWFTPFNTSKYYTLYAVPEEFVAERAVVRVLCKAIMEKFGGGKILGVTGVPGFSTDFVRTRGRNAALKEFPKIKLVDQLPGNFNREDSEKACSDLLAKHSHIVGVVAQNDDSAQGCIAALRAAGYTPGEDVLVSGADGTNEGAESIKAGRELVTSANVPAFLGAMFTARLYDVSHGWQPRAAERMMYWRSVTMTKDNVDAYLKRYVNNNGVLPFDFRKMSKVLHPKDWDPQALMYPMNIDEEWKGIAKPKGWTYPNAYLRAKNDGEWEKVAAEYKAHYKIPMFGPSPMAHT